MITRYAALIRGAVFLAVICFAYVEGRKAERHLLDVTHIVLAGGDPCK